MLKILYTDGTSDVFPITRLDRDEVDQFLDDIATGRGGILLTDDGQLCIPASASGIRLVRVLVDADAWTADRVGGEDFDDD